MKENDIITKSILYVCALILLVLVTTIFYAVFMRYIIKNAPSWSAELSILLVIWLTFLSTIIGVKENSHVRMTLFDKYLSKNTLKYLDYLYDVVMIIISLILLYYGLKHTINLWNATSSSLGISRSYWYLPIPVTSVFIIIILIGKWGKRY